jgi:glycosyltransferase involved in cell wall biosynthesis
MKISKIRHKKSVLFFNPDYHCSFFLRDELRLRGWRAEISVGSDYPERMLWSDDVKRFSNKLNRIQLIRRWASIAKYRYVVHYGAIGGGLGFFPKIADIGITTWIKICQLFGLSLVYVPSGCKDYMSQTDWMKVEGGSVCGSCGYKPQCDDKKNNKNFSLVRKVSSTALMNDGQQSSEFKESRIRYKSLDLEVFSPSLSIPECHIWPPSTSIQVLHSSSLDSRLVIPKNIKGTEFLVRAVDSLVNSGLDVKLVQVKDVPSRAMRFHQVQADVVVDQLIYGGYGSTALECLALGKPVICYIRPSWKQFLKNHFAEWEWCPIISANPQTVEAELRKLVVNEELRIKVGDEGRKFAEQFLDVKKNVVEFERLLLGLEK